MNYIKNNFKNSEMKTTNRKKWVKGNFAIPRNNNADTLFPTENDGYIALTQDKYRYAWEGDEKMFIHINGKKWVEVQSIDFDFITIKNNTTL